MDLVGVGIDLHESTTIWTSIPELCCSTRIQRDRVQAEKSEYIQSSLSNSPVLRKLQTSLSDSTEALKQPPDGALHWQSPLQPCPDFEDEIIVEEVDPSDFEDGWIIEDFTDDIESDLEVSFIRQSQN